MVICPHCEKEYDKDQIIIEKVQEGLKESHYVYSCPRCGKLLSDSY